MPNDLSILLRSDLQFLILVEEASGLKRVRLAIGLVTKVGDHRRIAAVGVGKHKLVERSRILAMLLVVGIKLLRRLGKQGQLGRFLRHATGLVKGRADPPNDESAGEYAERGKQYGF